MLEKKHCKYIPFYKDELVIIAPNMEKYRRIQEECPNDISWLEREHVIDVYKRQEVSSEKLGDKEFKVVIRMNGAMEAASQEDPACIPDRKGNMVVAVSSDRMGSGNDELGKVLIKGFIFAVTQLDELPKTMLFYNGGATLTTEGSDSLEDLKSLEAQGVEILTCGTCLDYYGLKDKLAVGSVTNMYSIVETLAGADKIIKP